MPVDRMVITNKIVQDAERLFFAEAGWARHDIEALDALFSAYPENTCPWQVLLKVTALNALYKTRIMNVYPVVETMSGFMVGCHFLLLGLVGQVGQVGQFERAGTGTGGVIFCAKFWYNVGMKGIHMNTKCGHCRLTNCGHGCIYSRHAVASAECRHEGAPISGAEEVLPKGLS